MHCKLLVALLCLAIVAGCGKPPSEAEKPQATAQTGTEASAVPQTSPSPQQASQQAPQQASQPSEAQTQPPQMATAKPAAQDDFRPPMPPQPSGEPARPGVGQLGIEIADGPLGTPVKALFGVQESLAFMRLKQPMEIYRAIYGHYPKSHEEFFKEIVQKNNIRLPPLPPGTRYLYDAQMAAEMSSYDVDNPPLRVVKE